MKGRCCTCKNWKRDTVSYSVKNYGECDCKLFFNGCEKEEADWPNAGFSILDDYYDYAEFSTSELFGCIHHSPLPDGETK